MNIKIFFSWQVKTNDGRYNKDFLLDAIETVIKSLLESPEFQTLKIELHKSVMSNGTAEIGNNISEALSTADIMIADFTPESKFRFPWKKKIRLEPTPNVLVEFGEAKAAIGLKNIITVVNSAYGSPSDPRVEWPFNLRHLEFPISYHLNRKSIKQLPSIKEEFVKALTTKLRSTIKHAIESEKTKFYPFLHGSKWEENSSTTFKTNETIERIFQNIRLGINQSNQTIRLIGLSGLGKTRILREFVGSEINPDILLNRVLYFNFNHDTQINLNAFVRNLVDKGENRLLIIDNCPREKHKELLSEFESNSNQNMLITIGDNPEEIDRNAISGVNYIQIKKDDLSSIVDDILREDFGELDTGKLEKIKEFAQGIPLMAVLIGESVRNGDPHIGNLEDKDLLDKLLGVVGKDPKKRKMLMSCALFSKFGFFEEKKPQIKYISTEKSITSVSGDDDVKQQEMEEVCNHFLSREIFEVQGRNIAMRPRPLAMYLAQEWLSTCSSERFEKVILSLSSLTSPDRKELVEAFAEQITLINYDPKAIQIVEDLFNYNGPFDNAEVLNTELGSRLFRSFVSVNPEAVSENLQRNLFSKTIDELRAIDVGRRNLVWTLEKLVFDKRTFHQSVKLLFKLAIAENETWGNNSTAQLLQLFSIYLAGTEVDLKERWNIIEWAINHEDPDFHELALKAMQRGLVNMGFTRIMGGEKQGTKELIDYQPNSDEIIEYWKNILNELEKIVEARSTLSDEAAKIVTSAIYTFHRAGLLKEHFNVINKIAETRDFDWDEALVALETLLNRHVLELGDWKEFRNLIGKLKKDDIVSRFKNVGNRVDRLPYQELRDKSIEEIKEIAEAFVKDENSWKLLPELFTIRQPYSYYFGLAVKEQLSEIESINKFIRISLKTIENLPEKDRNATILGGFVQGLNIDRKENLYNELAKNGDQSWILFYLISIDNDAAKHMDILFKLVDQGKAPFSSFFVFSLSPGLYKLSSTELRELIPKFFKYGSDGYYFSFDVLYDATYDRPETRIEFLDIFRQIIIEYGPGKALIETRESFKWKEIIIQILKTKDDPEMAQIVNNSIIESASFQNFSFSDFDVQHVYEILFDNYLDVVWLKLSEALLAEGQSYYQYYWLQKYLGSSIGGHGNSVGTLFRIDADFLFSWCRGNAPLAPIRMASMTPIYADNNTKYNEWHPIARRIIDEFGNNKDVLIHLSSNMGTFSWGGSLVPYYSSQVEMFEQLLDHQFPNVREWAESTISNLKIAVKNEKNRDEEMYL